MFSKRRVNTKPFGLYSVCVSFVSIYILIKSTPASVAQLDVCPTGEQEVAGSTLTGSAIFFHGDDHEIFSMLIHPSADSRRAVVSFW